MSLGSIVTGTKRKMIRSDDEMTLEDVVKKLKTMENEQAERIQKLENEKQKDKERIQNLENKVSELSRKRIVRIPSNPKKSFRNTNSTAV
jgi:SMC interacting uncharacterized protein involved in chromosome segregation